MNFLDADITPQLPGLAPFLLRGNAKHTALYFRKLFQLLHAGVSLAAALSTLGESATSRALQLASRDMERSIAGGTNWADAMRAASERFPGLFSPTTIALVAAAEMSGTLPQVCLHLSESAEKEYEIQQIIKRDTWYPKLLIFFSTVVIPVPIRLSWGESAVTLGFGAQVFIFATLWALWRAGSYLWPWISDDQRLRIDRWRLQLPIAGKTIRGFALAKFCRVLAASCEAGAPLSQGVSLAAFSCGNTALAEQIRPAAVLVERNHTLSQALAATGALPQTALPLLQSGEGSGDLPGQLQAIAHFAQSDATVSLRQSVVVFCIVIFLLVAFKIGVQVIQYHAG